MALNETARRVFAYLEGGPYPLVVIPDQTVQLAELRAILAPLLDDPLIELRFGVVVCVFCKEETDYVAEGDWRPRPPLHESDCPALRRDELLGRPG